MSEISTRLRNYVNDPTVADHYGEWGILRRDQRRQIRQLCDTCDMFEHAADAMCMEIEELKSKNSNLTSDLTSARAKIERLTAESQMADGYADALEEQAKAEAYKEFAERVKETAVTSITIGGSTYLCVGLHHLDNLVKELPKGDNTDGG